VQRHRNAYGENPVYHEMLDVGGDYACPRSRRGSCLDAGIGREAANMPCEAIRPRTIATTPRRSTIRPERLLTLRGLMEFKFAPEQVAA